MDLLKKEFLEHLKEVGFPQNKICSGQIWYDVVAEKHGVVIGNTLFYIGDGYSGFSTISEQAAKEGLFLLCPTVQQFLWFTPNAKIEIWGNEFSVKIERDESPKRFSSANPLEACARAYIYARNK